MLNEVFPRVLRNKKGPVERSPRTARTVCTLPPHEGLSHGFELYDCCVVVLWVEQPQLFRTPAEEVQISV
jgi:hypothetical protein